MDIYAGFALSSLNESFTYPVFIYIFHLNSEGLAYLERAVCCKYTGIE